MGDRAQAAWQGKSARVTSGRSVARPAESAAKRNGILVTAPKRPAGLRPRAPASTRTRQAISAPPTCTAGFQGFAARQRRTRTWVILFPVS